MKIGNTVESLASYFKEFPKSKVIFLVGAGISTSCGIPDFRSPETGLYHNLSKLKLPFAEAVFDIDFYEENPEPFYTLAKELYPGNFKPSKFHYMMKLFQDKKRLERIYTQNIDTLERLAGIRSELIVEAHGSFADNHCISCGEEYPQEVFKSRLEECSKIDGKFDYAACVKCQSFIKPKIVFFGEDLPKRFFDTWAQDLETMQQSSKNGSEVVVIVAGTSLAVYPFASLPTEVPNTVVRGLMNKNTVGDFSKHPRKSDFLLTGDLDELATELMEHLGWSKEFNDLIVTEDKIDELINEIENLDIRKTKEEVMVTKELQKETNIKEIEIKVQELGKQKAK
ncbi:hypothetical protein TPHA_0P00380 [Tetrapisispora phaffii CBS 4417]|uniref:NAD-dependent protein deacetylase n=1 Tax=Tetrapisispora phaffii (strain ATCC 24235 / CBS 4417 / NBRC 1672 / NRRL Y-8282 / UCD 70-5) TaxID=1071381 RepID=G8C218_TETPH|nr:hypothetical protein TPHA_0P00380 [Tetrapisispora phaffii CBS 4417]CCE66196.1 hypothetical protein TPHA_0P00380 [Tetrapisispora phaffii CBS 4417]